MRKMILNFGLGCLCMAWAAPAFAQLTLNQNACVYRDNSGWHCDDDASYDGDCGSNSNGYTCSYIDVSLSEYCQDVDGVSLKLSSSQAWDGNPGNWYFHRANTSGNFGIGNTIFYKINTSGHWYKGYNYNDFSSRSMCSEDDNYMRVGFSYEIGEDFEHRYHHL